MSDSTNYITSVRDQYEDYPYPKRDPADEKHRLFATSTDALDWINYYCYEGRKDYSDNFRALVAGGGTGDGAIFLAEQLREYGAEVIYLDISRSSCTIAQKRAEIRDLTNIKWIEGSILDIPRLELGKFDYINCAGVLHHLEDPDEGLAALRSILKDDGAIGIMVYATYGRTGLYQFQDMMRLFNKGVTNQQEQVDYCKRALNILPPTNWLLANKALFDGEIAEYGDIGIYDLFLHTRDRSYTVPELYDFIESAGLNILQLFASHEPRGNNLYNPASYISDPILLDRANSLTLKEQHAAAELLHGRISKHMFYAAPTKRKIPALDNLENIPCLSVAFNQQAYRNFHTLVKNAQDVIEIQSAQQKNIGIKFHKTPHTEELFRYLDGKRSLRDIFKAIRNNHTTPPALDELLREFGNIFKSFNTHNWMLLRDSSVKPFTDVQTLQEQVNKMNSSRFKDENKPLN